MSGGQTNWKRIALGVGGLVALGLIGGAVGGAVGAWRVVCYDCPSVAQLYNWQPRQSTRILSHDGQVIGELALERRTPVELDSLPEYVPQAFIAIEDKRFYRHGGYDLRGYARAFRNQLTGGVGGGSTITLQLARHMFIEEVGFDQSLRRKLRELHVAVDLEHVYEKDEILEAYINQINYDNGWYGISVALPEHVLAPDATVQDVDHVEHVAPRARQIMPVCSGNELARCGEIEKGYSENAAITEANRCLQCGLICYQKTDVSQIADTETAVSASA